MKKRLMLIGWMCIVALSGFAQKKTGIAATPPMGWNSWNHFGCDVNEQLIKEMADAMAESGMAEAGYKYIVIDDCWQVDRDDSGRIIADPERFPSGMKALADYIHSKGLKFGIYSDAGKKTCQRRPGSRGYEAIDAATYAEWGIDYLKYDWCFNGIFTTSKELYPVMAKELADLDHPIVLSMCNWGRQNPSKWAGEYAHLWRTTNDIRPKFKGFGLTWRKTIMQIVRRQNGLEEYAGPDGWNDPDMLEVGNGKLTAAENRSHFTLWCMLAAPLMAGNDLRKMSDEVKDILTNKQVIAVNQDSLGKQAYLLDKAKGFRIYVKPLANDEWAVAVLNTKNKQRTTTIDLAHVMELDKTYKLTDVWENKSKGNTNDPTLFETDAHGIQMLRLTAADQ